MSFSCNPCLTNSQKFSMRFKSGLLPGQSSMNLIWQSLHQVITDLAVWQGSSSYWNMLPPVNSKHSSRCSFSSSKYMYWLNSMLVGNATSFPAWETTPYHLWIGVFYSSTKIAWINGITTTLPPLPSVTVKITSSDQSTSSQSASSHWRYFKA